MNNLKAEFKAEKGRLQKKKLQEMVARLRDATPKDTGAAAAGWDEDGVGIFNPVEYVPDLNAGASKQAGSRFIEKTILLDTDIKVEGLIVRNV